MIFKQLTIKNFRQFYGQQLINFAIGKNNVTVIHGFNGSGKTTLLNAFTWLFYGEFSPDFENSEYLETEAAFAQLELGQNLITSVKLIFQDKGRDYTAERSIGVGKDNKGQRWIQKSPELTLKYIDETGEVREPGNPQDSLEQLLPKPLYLGSLVDKARSTYDEKADPNKSILFKGGLYPLVIDSAFGQLEPEYKRDVASWIPTLAPQVIVLVSESQWKKEVEEELQARIGSEWILECSTSKKRTKNITLRGREYQYVVESNDGFERTAIFEVKI
jgi:energy-coupling factor transporter ATP-binding protein EcfA2